MGGNVCAYLLRRFTKLVQLGYDDFSWSNLHLDLVRPSVGSFPRFALHLGLLSEWEGSKWVSCARKVTIGEETRRTSCGTEEQSHAVRSNCCPRMDVICRRQCLLVFI